MEYNLTLRMLKGECWYGGSTTYAFTMPIKSCKLLFFDNSINKTYNQSSPFYLSNKGRFIWSEDGFRITFTFGKITCKSNTSEIFLKDGYGDLRGAFLAGSSNHFPPDKTHPDLEMFRVPQYCTWIELQKNQNQQGIIDYAQSILDANMPAGELIIDDGWQTNFGDWSFNPQLIPDPKEMINRLHQMGFKVILWIAPFVSRLAIDKTIPENLLVRDYKLEIAYRDWWNGNDALIDLSNPDGMKWFKDTAEYLMNEFSVDGFKQDAGDSFYYRATDQTHGNVLPNQQSILWAESARDYKFNELRACFKCGGYGIAQRLCDKSHAWNIFAGLRALLPSACLHGLLGYPFTCPDMIGGGQSKDFYNKDPGTFDNKLFVRYAQASALMPMMQYSYSLWRLKNKNTANLCREACNLHTQFSDYICELAKNAANTGEPIVRFMEYDFPNQNLERAKQQFMLGTDYLVAPMVWKNKKSRSIMLPTGKWQLLYNEEIIEGGRTIKLTVPLNVLPIFKKLS